MNSLAMALAWVLAGSAEVKAPDGARPESLRRQLVGLPYAEARAKLIAQGWQPAMIKRAAPAGAAKVMVELGHAEVESCSEGEVVCSFLFGREDGSCLHVTTGGAGKRARVQHLDRRCFDEE